MKKEIALLLSAAVMVSMLAACGTQQNSTSEQNESNQIVEAPTETTAPTVSETMAASGSVTVYDFGDSKLHVYASGDALGDVAYIVEGEDALVGIELPSFTEGLDAWQNYIPGLNKPMNDLFLCDHATGASYVEGMTIYGTQGTMDSIVFGSTYATRNLCIDFHGGPDMANINKAVSDTITVAGIDFNLIDHGETYDLEILSMGAIYTHMLGKPSHSILASTAHMDTLIDTLKSYQDADYDMRMGRKSIRTLHWSDHLAGQLSRQRFSNGYKKVPNCFSEIFQIECSHPRDFRKEVHP